MSFDRVHRSSPQSSQASSSPSQFAPRPCSTPTVQSPPTQEELENQAFQQDKFEATGLQIKQRSGTITPMDQEKLGVLQAKMDSFWAQRMERSNAQPNLLKILMHNTQGAPFTEPSADDGKASTDLEHTINQARGGGQPLEAGLQQSMGQAMAADFSHVKIHADAQADHLNQSLQAKAFTIGQDIFFHQGAYQPGSQDGQKLIAHELTHVVQQIGHHAGGLSAGSEVIQRFQAQIVATEDTLGNGVIADIKLSGRTPSPFMGTMGAHSTAWTVHTDGIRRQLQGLSLDAAIARMKALLAEEIVSPQWTSATISAGHRPDRIFGPAPGLRTAMERASNLSKTGYTGKDESGKATWLEDFIDAYLDLVNRLPLATVESGSKSGDDEGNARKVLIPIEGGGKQDPGVIRTNFALLFATDTPSAFVRDMPSDVTKADEAEVWAIGLYTFLRGLRLAYPNAYEMAELHDDNVLETFLQGLHLNVPLDIIHRLQSLGDPGGLPDQPPLQFLQGGAGDITGGDLAIQVRFSDSGTVADIGTEGRTPSPFVGSMGAHSTAWIAHLDGLRGALRGRDLNGAIQAVLTLAHQAQTSSLLKLSPFILPDQARLLARSQVELQYFQQVIQEESASELIQKTRLQQLIAAYLQFYNALPLHTAEAANTGSHGEGTHRENLRLFEAGKRELKKEQKKTSKSPAPDPVSDKKRLEKAFWGLYDPGSVQAFTENLFPTPVPTVKRSRGDGRTSRTSRTTIESDRKKVETENREKKDLRDRAYHEKPLSKEEQGILDQLDSGADKVEIKEASILLPQAMALMSFLHTMEVAYPRSYAASWGDLDDVERSRLTSRKLNTDGSELLNLMATLPKHEVIKGDTKLALKMETTSSSSKKTEDISKYLQEALIDYEQSNARRDGITAQYVVGHASGSWNACLIFSLLCHALGRDATNEEVQVIRDSLTMEHDDIAEARQINIYSETGHAIIQAIETIHNVSLNVAVVTTREAPVVPVTEGEIPALLYLMPGHFAPCWRRG
jgi:Domain of unknown function (DUF4157)